MKNSNCNYTAAQWQSVPPSKVDINEETLLKLDPIIRSQYNNINGIIIVHKGNIVLERYYNGYGINDKFHVASITKSILNALIGIAIDKKYIKSIEERVLDFFPEYTFSSHDEQKNKVTLHNLLTMTTPYPFEDWKEPLDKLCTQADWVKYTLDSLGEDGEIGKFKYSTAGAHLISAIITRSTGKCARDFANEYLFKPIGIKPISDYKVDKFDYEYLFGKKLKGWPHDPNGNSTGGWGLNLTTRDMAKLGLLYLNNGIWNDKQILSKNWIKESTTMHEGENDFMSYKYGYLWWLQKDDVFSYSAIGDGGNMICCIPEKDLVVAISCEIIPQTNDRWELIKNHIIPFIKN